MALSVQEPSWIAVSLGVGMLALEVLSFSTAWWLGLYLIARNPTKVLLRLAGLGLVAYALALAADALRATEATGLLDAALTRLHLLLIFLPALLWSGALVQLLPADTVLRPRLMHGWTYGVVPVTALCLFLGVGTASIPAHASVGYLTAAMIVLLPLVFSLFLVVRERHTIRPGQPLGLILTAGLLFTLSIGLLIFPLSGALRPWMLLSMGIDLELLGVSIALWDAFDEGEALRRDIARSFAAAGLSALLFGILVLAAITSGAGTTLPMIGLLLATIAVAIGLQTFDRPVQALLDRLAFAGMSRLQQERTEARAVATAQGRANTELDVESLDEVEFVRLTRRALSHYGDLSHLAASPLTRLPIVTMRLAKRGAAGDSLEAANELKTLLAESIARLKPRGSEFGTSDEWRYYNALHFPYVVGLRPYSRRLLPDSLDPPAREALEWFRTSVPERTLHNWQNTAARLVAQDLRGSVKRET